MSGAAGHKHRRWRLSGKKHAIESVRNDINVTPLVDVMLVLLIIFMLMTLVMGRGQEVKKLPQAENFSEEKDKQQPVVTVAGDYDEFAIYVEKTRVGPANPSSLKEMRDQIENHWKKPETIQAGGANRVYLKADAGVPYDKIYPVLRYLNREMMVPAVDIAIAQRGDK